MEEPDALTPMQRGEQPDFTVHQLKVFQIVARRLSYTKAAETLYLSQPAVSQQVKTLEQALGLKLFARSGRGIMLTSAGQELQQHVERLLLLIAETEPVVREIHALARGSVQIGASNSAGTYVMPPLLSAFHTQYARIQVTLVVANRRSIEEKLLDHQIDLAVMSLIEQPDRLVVEPLQPYELVIVAAPSHRLAGHSTLTPQDLLDETFLLREHGSGTRMDTELHFKHLGISLRAGLELNSIEAIKEGVAANLGIAVLPHEAVAFEIATGDLVKLDVQGFPLQRQWHLVHLQGRRLSQAALALKELLLQSRL